MTRALLIGEQPLAAHPEARPLAGRSARMLCEIAGIDHDDPLSTVSGCYPDWWTAALYGAFDCLNLITVAGQWSAPRAREAARCVIDLHRPRVIVCLGRRVQWAVGDALGFRGVRVRSGPHAWGGLFGNWGTWIPPWYIHPPTVVVAGSERHQSGNRSIPGGSCNPDPHSSMPYAPFVVTVPHPSGLNRTLNNPEARERMGHVLNQARRLAAAPTDHREILQP